jgi:hypothetical protein
LLAAGRTLKPHRAQIRPALATAMSGSSSIGRGGGQIGRGDDDEEEAKKRRSDAAILRGSKRWTNYGLRPPPKFNRWEACANQGCPLPGTPASAPAASCRSRYDAAASSSSSAPGASPSRVSRATMEVDAATPSSCPTGARIGPEDYVLIEESNRQEAERAAKWRREAELQELLIDAVSSDDEL